MSLDLVQEVVDMIRVSPGGLPHSYNIEYPSSRQVQRRWTELGIRVPAPEPENKDFWERVDAKFREELPARRKMAPLLFPSSAPTAGMPNPEPVIQTTQRGKWIVEDTTLPPPSSAPQSVARNVSPPSSPRVRDENRLAIMKSAEALRLCGLLNLKVEPHPTNPGITAMRAKNQLKAAINHGKELPP